MDRTRTGLIVGAIIAGSLVVGALTAFQPAWAVGMAILLLGAVASGFDSRALFLSAAGVALAVPTGWNMRNALPFMTVNLGAGSADVQVLLALLALGGGVVAALGIRRGEDAAALRFPAWTATVLVWLGVSVVGLLLGLVTYGTRAAFSDVQVYLLYGLMLVPLLGAGLWSRTSPHVIVGVALSGLCAYGAWVLAVLLSGRLHDAVYAGTGVGPTRVGFGTTSLLVIFIPLATALFQLLPPRRGARLLVGMALGIMGLTVLAAQSRAALAALAVGLVIFFLWPGRSGFSGRRRAASLVVIVVVVVIGVVVVLVSPDLMSSATDFASRGLIGSADVSFQSRVMTFAALWARLSSGGRILYGSGMGSTALTVAPSGATVYEALFVDNTFLTVALKSGVIGVLSLVALLSALWGVAVGLARRGSALARAVASSLPAFVVVAGLSTAHLVNAPSIPVGLSVITAVLVAETGRLRDSGREEGM